MASKKDMADGVLSVHTLPYHYHFSSLLDQQLQLFQLFHLWQTLPEFSLITLFSPSQKEASFVKAFCVKGLFMLFTSFPNHYYVYLLMLNIYRFQL